MEEQVENIPRSILQNIQSILEGLENFFSLVYTVYIVGKELRSMIIQPFLLNLTPMSIFFMETVGITAVATRMEGKNLKYIVCVYWCVSPVIFSHPHH